MNQGSSIAVGIAVGIAIGVVIGILMDNIAIGLAANRKEKP